MKAGCEALQQILINDTTPFLISGAHTPDPGRPLTQAQAAEAAEAWSWIADEVMGLAMGLAMGWIGHGLA